MLLTLVSLESIGQELQVDGQAPRTHSFWESGSEHYSKSTTMNRYSSARVYCGSSNFLLQKHALLQEKCWGSGGFFFFFLISLEKKQTCRNGATETLPVTSQYKNSHVTSPGFHSGSKTAFHVCSKPEQLAKARSHGNHVKQALIYCTFGLSLFCIQSPKIHPPHTHVSCVSLSVCKNPYGIH